MTIYFASDHAGFDLKGKLIAFAREFGFDAIDLGPASLQPDDDFPAYVLPLARTVVGEPNSRGVVIGASGQGEAMAANRVKGARAAVYYGPAQNAQTDAHGDILNLIQSSRAHNDANILSLGARFVTEDEAKDALKLFLDTPFSGEERHVRRIAQIDA